MRGRGREMERQKQAVDGKLAGVGRIGQGGFGGSRAAELTAIRFREVGLRG